MQPGQRPPRQPLAVRDVNILASSGVKTPPPSKIPAKGFTLAYDVMQMSPLESPPVGHAALRGDTSHSPSSIDGESTAGAVKLASPSNLQIRCTSNEYENIVESGAGTVTTAVVDDAHSFKTQGESALPPAWDELMQFLEVLPFPTIEGQADDDSDLTSAGTPPQTTIGLMVKPDPDNTGLGLITGMVEGSSADLSGEVMIGDVVLKVDGTPFNLGGLKRMRGGKVAVSAGKQMQLTLQRQGKGVFECVLIREPYPSVLLKRELSNLLSRLRESLSPLNMHCDGSPGMDSRSISAPESQLLLEAAYAKLVELEKTNINSLSILRSELHGLQGIMEKVVHYIKDAVIEGHEVMRTLVERIEDQDAHISDLSARIDEKLVKNGVHSSHDQTSGEHHISSDQMSLLRHECQRLRSTLSNKEIELEDLRSNFEKKLEEQGLREFADEKSSSRQDLGMKSKQREDMSAGCGEDSDTSDALQNALAQLQQERDSNNLERAVLKRDLWVSVIRRWLNNCCRRIITNWRSELARKHYYCVVCQGLENKFRLHNSRRCIQAAFSAFSLACFEIKRRRHAGVTAASGWLFLRVRNHLQAWLALADWSAFSNRFASQLKAKFIARAFNAWSRRVNYSSNDRNAAKAAANMSSIKLTAETLAADTSQEDVRARNISPQTKAEVADKSAQSLRWETDAAIQCNLLHDCSDSTSRTCALQTRASQCQSAVADKDEKSDKPSMKGVMRNNTIVYNKSLQERFEQEQSESRRLRESLAKTQEVLSKQEGLLRNAQDANRCLKESLQTAHAQLHRSLRDAEEERRRASQLGKELEQLERKLLISHDERDELRNIVADERRINARGSLGIYKRLSPPIVRHIMKQDEKNSITASNSSPNGSPAPQCTHALVVARPSTSRIRLMCLNMALSKQWRRITVIFVCWSSCVRQINNQRHGMMILTSRRFWAIMRRFLGVWCTFSKHLRRKEVLLSISLSQRWRRVLLKVLKVLKRMVFESRAARELYGLGALDDTTSSPVQADAQTKALSRSITSTRLKTMADKIQEGRRSIKTLDSSTSNMSSEVQKYEMAFRSAEAVIEELSQRIHHLQENAIKSSLSSPPKLEPTSVPAFAQSGRCNKEMSQEGRKDFIPGINTAKVLYTRKTDTHQGAASSNHEDFEGEDMMREVASDGKKQGKLPTNKNRWHDTRLALSYSRPAGANQAEGILPPQSANEMPNSRPPRSPSSRKPSVPQSSQHTKRDLSNERRYRVLGNIVANGSDHELVDERVRNPTVSLHRRDVISRKDEHLSPEPGKLMSQGNVCWMDATYADSEPPTPSGYTTGPGRDGQRGRPSPQPTDSPGLLTPALKNLKKERPDSSRHRRF